MRDPAIDPHVGDIVYGSGGWREVVNVDWPIVMYTGYRKTLGNVLRSTWRRWAKGSKFELAEDRGPRMRAIVEVQLGEPRAMGVIRGIK